MRFLYATSIRYPSRFANPEQIVATSNALYSKLGEAFVLGLHELRTTLPFPHVIFKGTTKSPILGLAYARYAKRTGVTHIYCREDRLLLFIMIWSRVLGYRPRFFFEVHTLHTSAAFKLIAKRVDGMVAITHGLAHDLEKTTHISKQNIIVAPDGVDLEAFSKALSKTDARAKLSLPQDAHLVFYIGQLGSWKGVETFLKASRLSKSTFVVIGGEPQEITAFQTRYDNVIFLGRRPYDDLADNQAAADVLVLPNTARDTTSVRYTSPLKLFSYMASGRPIVVSDLPSLREIVGDSDVFFFEPDNAQALAKTLEEILQDPTRANEKAERAKEKARHYTWSTRAQTILEHIQKK